MRMTVSPAEIAKHLIDELGHQKASEACKYHLGRCIDDETTSVWVNIGNAVDSMKPGEKR